MLVLARQRDQTIMIGDDIEVTVVDVRGEKVRLGITAPRSVSVHRKEVYQSIQKENQDASKIVPVDLGNSFQLKPVLGPCPDPFMTAALDEARAGLAEGGLPIGSVLVRDGQIVGRGHNRRVQDNDPMRHAEIDCLARAGRQKTYKDTILYSTLSPCHLCSGAVVQFGIPRVVIGESINFPGAPDFLRSHGVQVTDVRDPDCVKLMAEFIQSHPDLWHEDIGK